MASKAKCNNAKSFLFVFAKIFIFNIKQAKTPKTTV